jgi:nucleoside-triphosphatase THEP1
MVRQAVLPKGESGSFWKQNGLPKSQPGLNWKGEFSVQFKFDSPDSLLASFHSNFTSGQLILITGQSGSGKTNWCQNFAIAAVNQGIQPEGLLSPAVFSQGIKIGIDLMNISSGEKKTLAVRHDTISSLLDIHTGIKMSDWLIDPEVLSWGNKILSMLPTSRELLVLDELGPLEFLENTGLTAGLELITHKSFKLACVVVRPTLLGIALEQWPWAEVLHTVIQPTKSDHQ